MLGSIVLSVASIVTIIALVCVGALAALCGWLAARKLARVLLKYVNQSSLFGKTCDLVGTYYGHETEEFLRKSAPWAVGGTILLLAILPEAAAYLFAATFLMIWLGCGTNVMIDRYFSWMRPETRWLVIRAVLELVANVAQVVTDVVFSEKRTRKLRVVS